VIDPDRSEIRPNDGEVDVLEAADSFEFDDDAPIDEEIEPVQADVDAAPPCSKMLSLSFRSKRDLGCSISSAKHREVRQPLPGFMAS
jgi:hypothetical protein